MNYKDMRERAQSAPHPLAEQGQEEEAQGKNLRSASIPQVQKSAKSSEDVSLKSSFGTLASAAKDVIKEGPVGPQKLDEMVYHSRSMEKG